MRDFATSDDPAVQFQLDRLAFLSLPEGRIGLQAVTQLLERLGDPHQSLPPVFHVAGTNGKGSVCAFLRAMMEAQGLQVHSTTSPHLVRYNERIRLAGHLIDDPALAALLGEVIDASESLAVSFFEVTIAAAFLAFSRTPADACIVEVGLGGRLDATNVVPRPAVCGIATLGIDHERFLLAPEAGTPADPLARIAFEKSGIAKPGSPLVTLAYPDPAAEEVARAAMTAGAPLHVAGQDWFATISDTIEYRDRHGTLMLPNPTLTGAHQAWNAALATAMVRHQDRVPLDPQAIAHGIEAARWPARLQRLSAGPVRDRAGGHAVWLDGGHNPDAGAAIARHFAGTPLHLVIGMLEAKAPDALTGPLGDGIASLQVVPVPGHPHHGVEAFGPDAQQSGSVVEALDRLPDDGLPVLVAGSLYLAGAVLRQNGEVPD